MPARKGDLIAGIVLLALGVAWIITVWVTVPSGYGVGPRAFPLWLGFLLTGLSAILVVNSLRQETDNNEQETQVDTADKPPVWLQLKTLFVVCATVAVYGYLMQAIGFVPATILVVAYSLVFTLKERRPVVVLGMSLGLAFGAWFAFGKILGAYMPPGTLISIF